MVQASRKIFWKTDWAVSLAERPVHISKSQDVATFGRAFSHPFLILKTPDDNVMAEIHGSWKRRSKVETGIAKAFDKVSGKVRSERLNAFMEAASGAYYPQSEVRLMRGPHQFKTAIAEHILFEGPVHAARDIWVQIADMIPVMNNVPKPYYRYARRGERFSNCQIMMRDMLDAVAPALQSGVPELRLAQTGWTASPKTDISLRL